VSIGYSAGMKDFSAAGGRSSADASDMSEEELALIVAMQGGFEPRPDDPLAKALETRGFARSGQAGGDAWSLTESGVAYRPS
jgi:hypothetical protein